MTDVWEAGSMLGTTLYLDTIQVHSNALSLTVCTNISLYKVPKVMSYLRQLCVRRLPAN